MFQGPSAARGVRLAGSTEDVLVRRLHRDPADATQNEVRFPPGWARPGAGSFDVAEEVLWLSGTMRMSGRVHHAGSYAWFPAGFVRSASTAPEGARALAWFSGPPTWTPVPERSTTPTALSSTPVVVVVAEVPVRPGPVPGTMGRVLRQRPDGGTTWLLDGVHGGAAPVGGVLLVPLDARGALELPAGAPLPLLDEPVLLRTGRS